MLQHPSVRYTPFSRLFEAKCAASAAFDRPFAPSARAHCNCARAHASVLDAEQHSALRCPKRDVDSTPDGRALSCCSMEVDEMLHSGCSSTHAVCVGDVVCGVRGPRLDVPTNTTVVRASGVTHSAGLCAGVIDANMEVCACVLISFRFEQFG